MSVSAIITRLSCFLHHTLPPSHSPSVSSLLCLRPRPRLPGIAVLAHTWTWVVWLAQNYPCREACTSDRRLQLGVPIFCALWYMSVSPKYWARYSKPSSAKKQGKVRAPELHGVYLPTSMGKQEGRCRGRGRTGFLGRNRKTGPGVSAELTSQEGTVRQDQGLTERPDTRSVGGQGFPICFLYIHL